jgi:hypothetical protein
MEKIGESQAPPPPNFDVSGVQNLDTARMALRWALERIQKLEQAHNDLSDKLKAEEGAKRKAQDECVALERTLSLRTGEESQRELYYAKLEEFLSLKLDGKIDLAKMARREQELAELQEILARKEARLQKDFEARKTVLERDFELSADETLRKAKSQVEHAERSAEAKKETLEEDHVQKLARLHEGQVLLKRAEAALAERKAHFENYYGEQRARLESELRNFRAEIDDQVKLKVELAERLLEERVRASESAFTRERVLLLRELENWKTKAQELAPKAIDLERDASVLEEKARQAQSQADAKTLILEERSRAFEHERKTLVAETEHWKSAALAALDDLKAKSAEFFPIRLELEQKLAAAEETGAAAERGLARRQEFEQLWSAERSELDREIAALREKLVYAASRIRELEKNISDPEN